MVTRAVSAETVAKQNDDYVIADPASSGFDADPKLFYDEMLRGRIRAMVSHVIEIEGPLYDDVLVLRIARAHDFSRAAGRIRDIVLGAIDAAHPRTTDDGSGLVQPKNADVQRPVRFRPAPLDIRALTDIPLVELRTLDQSFRLEGADQEEIVRRMAAQFNLGKLSKTTRHRFETAIS